MRTEELVRGVTVGDQRLVARAISVVETGGAPARRLVAALYGAAGAARIVGITGPPGVGKSTLVDGLAREWRRANRRVAILAVDPTSPFSGGALLGDRIRMQAHAGDEGVYLRSMATRGHLGGLAHATADAAVVVAAAGAEVVLIETVGVGQGEVDIARTADVSVVVTVPGTGDDVQALKAGIMEIADLFVVNKADRPGADRAVAEIRSALTLQEAGGEDVPPPVLKTEAATGRGVPELFEMITSRVSTRERDRPRLRGRAEVRLRQALTTHLLERVTRSSDARTRFEETVERVVRREVDPYTAAQQLLEQLDEG